MGVVKVMKLGDEVADVPFEGENVALSTVLEGIETEGFEVRVNDEEPEEGQMLEDGAVVTLVPEVKGG